MELNTSSSGHPRVTRLPWRRRRSGLTLLEVLVVITILAMLASLLVVNYRGTLGGAKHKIAKQEVAKLRDLVEQYYFETGSYPSQSEGLAVLTQPLPGRNEPLLRGGRLSDPWGNPYIYVYPGIYGPFDIISYGADGVEGGEGENADIICWDLDGADEWPVN